MIVEIPLFGVGINYFPTEISVLKIFEPRYLLLVGDSIKNNTPFCVSENLNQIGQIVSEVKILDHKDISNAEQVVVVECISLKKVRQIKLDSEYPSGNCELVSDIGIPPTESELDLLQKDIQSAIGKLIEQGMSVDLPVFEIESFNRILKLWELSSKIPMAEEMKKSLIYENDVSKRFEKLKNYLDNLNNLKF